MAAVDGGLTGVVLAGGASSRLGLPKALVMVGGQMLLARVKGALDRVCAEIVLVVAPGQDDATPDTGLALGMHVVADNFPDSGPLAGMEAGLAATGTPLAFVVGADYPFISPRLVSDLARQVRQGGYDAVVPSLGGTLQPLHAVYSKPSWLPLVRRALEDGRRSPYDLIKSALSSGGPSISVCDESDMAALDPDGRSLFDIDTPERLAEARRMLGHAGTVRPDIRRGGL